ncbi:hypothetical protein [Sphingobacterium sp. UME9]|nr:hypothetical protein [Sphingobacterium sp. UME9]
MHNRSEDDCQRWRWNRGKTVTYQGRDYKCDTDRVEWGDGRYHFLGY